MSVSQTLAKLRSPAVLVSQNGNSLALPNYMADAVEETRANIVAALCCSTSALTGPSRMASHSYAATTPWGAVCVNASGASSVFVAGATDGSSDGDDEGEGQTSRPMEPPLLPSRSRRKIPSAAASPTSGQSSPARKASSHGPTSAAPPPASPCPPTRTPLVSFNDQPAPAARQPAPAARRPATCSSDSAAAAAQAAERAAGLCGGMSALSRRPLSASASTQAQAPVDPFAAAAAAQQDLIAAITGRAGVIETFDYDDDSFDEEELANDLAAAQNTLARALEMARSGTTNSSITSTRVSGAAGGGDGSAQSSQRSSTVSTAAGSGSAGAGAARRFGQMNTGSQISVCNVVEVEITPAPRQLQQPMPHQAAGSLRRGSAEAGGGAASPPPPPEGILDRFSRNGGGHPDVSSRPSVTGSGGATGGGAPWLPQSATPACPSPVGSRTPSTASSAPAATSGSSPNPSPAAGGHHGFGRPLCRALHLGIPGTAASTVAPVDIEAGQGTLGAAERKDGVVGGGGGGIGRFSLKEGMAVAQQAVADATAKSAGAGGGGSSQGSHSGLKVLLSLAKKAFRRSTGSTAATVAPPLPQSPPQAISDHYGRTATSPVAVPPTPPAKPGASPGLGSSSAPSPAAGKAAAGEQSRVLSGRPLPSSSVVAAAAGPTATLASQAPGPSPSSRGGGSSSSNGCSGGANSRMPCLVSTISAPSSSPPPSPLSLAISAPPPLSDGFILAARPSPPQLLSQSEGGCAGSIEDCGLAHTALSPPAYGSGVGAVSQRRRSCAVSTGGASELQVTAHRQSFMHYQQKQLQQQMRQLLQQNQLQPTGEQRLLQQPRLFNSLSVGATAGALEGDGGSGGGGSQCSSRSASGEVGRSTEPSHRVRDSPPRMRRPTSVWAKSGDGGAAMAAAAAKMPYQASSDGSSSGGAADGRGSGGWRPLPVRPQVLPPPLPPPPSQVKTLPAAAAVAGVGVSVSGSPRWSPRSPLGSPTCHVGSPLGPYHQQPLQQQQVKGYSLNSQPTSPRTSLHGGSHLGQPSSSAPLEECGKRSSGLAAAPLSCPGPNFEQGQQQPQQQQQTCVSFETLTDIRTSRTSPAMSPASPVRPPDDEGCDDGVAARSGDAAVTAASDAPPLRPYTGPRIASAAGPLPVTLPHA